MRAHPLRGRCRCAARGRRAAYAWVRACVLGKVTGGRDCCKSERERERRAGRIIMSGHPLEGSVRDAERKARVSSVRNGSFRISWSELCRDREGGGDRASKVVGG
jgi:hypothetical protein